MGTPPRCSRTQDPRALSGRFEVPQPMNAVPAITAPRRRTAVWLAVGLGLLLLFAANGHLVYVAMTSQPDCVDHVRAGSGTQDRFSAAKSACSTTQDTRQK